MSFDKALEKVSEKLNSWLLVQEEHGFQNGEQCAPLPRPRPQVQKAWSG